MDMRINGQADLRRIEHIDVEAGRKPRLVDNTLNAPGDDALFYRPYTPAPSETDTTVRQGSATHRAPLHNTGNLNSIHWAGALHKLGTIRAAQLLPYAPLAARAAMASNPLGWGVLAGSLLLESFARSAAQGLWRVSTRPTPEVVLDRYPIHEERNPRTPEHGGYLGILPPKLKAPMAGYEPADTRWVTEPNAGQATGPVRHTPLGGYQAEQPDPYSGIHLTDKKNREPWLQTIVDGVDRMSPGQRAELLGQRTNPVAVIEGLKQLPPISGKALDDEIKPLDPEYLGADHYEYAYHPAVVLGPGDQHPVFVPGGGFLGNHGIHGVHSRSARFLNVLVNGGAQTDAPFGNEADMLTALLKKVDQSGYPPEKLSVRAATWHTGKTGARVDSIYHDLAPHKNTLAASVSAKMLRMALNELPIVVAAGKAHFLVTDLTQDSDGDYWVHFARRQPE